MNQRHRSKTRVSGRLRQRVVKYASVACLLREPRDPARSGSANRTRVSYPAVTFPYKLISGMCKAGPKRNRIFFCCCCCKIVYLDLRFKTFATFNVLSAWCNTPVGAFLPMLKTVFKLVGFNVFQSFCHFTATADSKISPGSCMVVLREKSQ